MNVETLEKNGEARVVLRGRFDYSFRHGFKEACDTALASHPNGDIVIDLGGVDYIDSAALGMLLLLRDRAGALKRHVILQGPKGVVREVLMVAKFEKFFAIR